MFKINFTFLLFLLPSILLSEDSSLFVSEEGKIGIQTEDPQYDLDVNGQLNVSELIRLEPQLETPLDPQEGSIFLSENGKLQIFFQGAWNELAKAKLPAIAPSNLSLTSAEISSISFTWQDNDTNEIGYKIQFSDNESGPWNDLATLPENSTSYTDSGLDPLTTRHYRVIAFTNDLSSSPSNVLMAETLPLDEPNFYLDDFSDGDFINIDLNLETPTQSGMSWNSVIGTTQFYVTSTSTLTMGGSGLPSRSAWLFSEQGENWSQYSFTFNVYCWYLNSGAGPMFLTVDNDNYYYIDMGKVEGKLIRVINSQKSILSQNDLLRSAHNTHISFKININATAQGVIIEIDKGSDGNIDFSYTDTNSSAISTFTSGGVGFHFDTEAGYHSLSFTNISTKYWIEIFNADMALLSY